MNPFEFVLLLMAMIFLFSIVKRSGGVSQLRSRGTIARNEDEGEVRVLRDEVRQLKERLAVLERITVEKENSLSREIEDLRSR